MLLKRLIVCLDVRNRKVTKGVRFRDNINLGDPVEMAKQYSDDGADELVFYDITASAENRAIDLDMVRLAAENIFIPFTVGGGIRNVDEIRSVLLAGADKVSLNSLAVRHPEILAEGAKAFGRQCIVLGMDVKRNPAFPSGYQIVTCGGRQPEDLDALDWAQYAESLGAGEICLNAIDTDGVCQGYEMNITRLIAEKVGIPVIASGGAGKIEHLVQVLTEGKASAALVASMVHTGNYTCRQIKKELDSAGIPVRMS